eukprot:Clim_evm35s88 gene=Clim_evmTU35s88
MPGFDLIGWLVKKPKTASGTRETTTKGHSVKATPLSKNKQEFAVGVESQQISTKQIVVTEVVLPSAVPRQSDDLDRSDLCENYADLKAPLDGEGGAGPTVPTKIKTSDYEAQRAANVAKNQEFLAQLGLLGHTMAENSAQELTGKQVHKVRKPRWVGKKRRAPEPVRRSARVRREPPTYDESYTYAAPVSAIEVTDVNQPPEITERQSARVQIDGHEEYLDGHSHDVYSIAYMHYKWSRDEDVKILLAGGKGGKISIWQTGWHEDAQTGEWCPHPTTIKAHKSWVSSIQGTVESIDTNKNEAKLKLISFSNSGEIRLQSFHAHFKRGQEKASLTPTQNVSEFMDPIYSVAPMSNEHWSNTYQCSTKAGSVIAVTVQRKQGDDGTNEDCLVVQVALDDAGVVLKDIACGPSMVSGESKPRCCVGAVGNSGTFLKSVCMETEESKGFQWQEWKAGPGSQDGLDPRYHVTGVGFVGHDGMWTLATDGCLRIWNTSGSENSFDQLNEFQQITDFHIASGPPSTKTSLARPFCWRGSRIHLGDDNADYLFVPCWDRPLVLIYESKVLCGSHVRTKFGLYGQIHCSGKPHSIAPLAGDGGVLDRVAISMGANLIALVKLFPDQKTHLEYEPLSEAAKKASPYHATHWGERNAS